MADTSQTVGSQGERRHLAVVTMGLALYMLVLWFGVTIVGDNVLRSAVMAGVILGIAATGYAVNRRPAAPED